MGSGWGMWFIHYRFGCVYSDSSPRPGGRQDPIPTFSVCFFPPPRAPSPSGGNPLKITAQARYALRILSDLAVRGGRAPRAIRDIASSQGISEKFVGRIALPLRRAGFVESARGAKGGLLLARHPAKITLLDVVEAMDGPLALAPCLARRGACPRQGRCAAERAWGAADAALAASLRRITLADVARDERRFARPARGLPAPCD